jgi:hypothetical protein
VQEQQNKPDRGKIWFSLTMLRAQVWRDSSFVHSENLHNPAQSCTILHNPAQCRETVKPETKENKGLSAGVLSAALCTLPIAFTPLPNRTAPIWYDQSRG